MIAALAIAPASAEAANNFLEGITSARFSIAEVAVPATNPSWTIVVSQPVCAASSDHVAANCPETADAANHMDIPSSSATARRPSVRHRCGCVSAFIADRSYALRAKKERAPKGAFAAHVGEVGRQSSSTAVIRYLFAW